ncbi:ragulator complex protein LAMTOR1 isoform X2 [Strongylocentrotus purpuratus]|uniref:Ragulator complex protein LAMTOR1 n=1 Tax=Strongylocentrotus purpuratus TaxID=7668 RepID=A0A7M7HJ83_STRPU|nr:ragulator complex protein LAMTOR1 isoform X2 [Strongylocentrotus purpuratus]|eukprot:XP_011664191.1 PREDICTED: ragulator complex protein LAMTOR1 isoform X3 [Strongylocentrotus purpuratus]
MGCCFGKDDDSKLLDTDSNAPLIEERDAGYRPIRGSDQFSQSPNGVQIGDQQSELNKVLQRAVTNVIDVSAIDSQALEQHEYMDRARTYSSRVAVVVTGPKKPLSSFLRLPKGVSMPYSVLSEEPVSVDDINLITQTAADAWKASQDIQVTHKENLVVQFGMPQN